MQLKEWTENEISYALSNEYSIRKADIAKWGLYCSTYYNMQYLGFFREEGFDSDQRNAYWIYKGDSKIGGVRMSPNRIYHLFVIPPFNDTLVVLKLLKELLLEWSDRTQPIITFEVLPDQVQLFAQAGFWPDEFRCRWMQRPTDHFDIEWSDEFSIESPQIVGNGQGAMRYIQEDEITECNYASFKGSLEATRRKKDSYADFIPSEEPNYTNKALLEASTLVYDRTTGQLVANCLLGLQDDYAAVYSICVMPDYRGKGIATLMLKRGLNLLRTKYPILRLYVMEGNDAESVYINLGFVPGVQEIQRMYIPAKN